MLPSLFRNYNIVPRDFMNVLSISCIVAFVDHALDNEYIHIDIANQHEILAGLPLTNRFTNSPFFISPWYNRILFPSIYTTLNGLMSGIMSDKTLFTLIRFFEIIACYTLIYFSTKRRLAERGHCESGASSLLILSCMGLIMIATFSHLTLVGNDIIDLTICFFIFMFIFERRFLSAFVLSCVASFNRESGSFAGILFFIIYYRRMAFCPFVGMALSYLFIPYFIAVALRKYIIGDHIAKYPNIPAFGGGLSGQEATGVTRNIYLLQDWIHNPNPMGWLPLLLIIFYLSWLIFDIYSIYKYDSQRTLLSLLFMAIITFQFGVVAEIRVFLPCLALLFAAAIARRPPPELRDGWRVMVLV